MSDDPLLSRLRRVYIRLSDGTPLTLDERRALASQVYVVIDELQALYERANAVIDDAVDNHKRRTE